MKYCLGVPLMHGDEERAQFLDGEDLVEFALAAERAGFDALYVTEHPIPNAKWLTLGGHHAPDPFVSLAWIGAATRTIKLLTNITVVPYRNPFLLAKAAATLDRHSGGRLILGVGTGYQKAEYAALGVDFEERNVLFDEAMEVLRLTWTGDEVNYRGLHFDARGVRAQPRPAQDPLPIWIGGNSALTRRRVVAKAQGWMPIPNTREAARVTRTPVVETLDDLAAIIADLRAKAEEAGRSEPIEIMFMCSEGGAPEDDRFDAQRHLEALAAQEAIGVTATALNGAEGPKQRALDAIARYGAEVIAPSRR